MALLSIEGVGKEYFARGRRVVALESINLDIAEGEFVTIVGPSGCGKSTMLNLIVGLLRASSGRITFRGAPIDGICTKIGYVTQKDNLLPWRTLVENVEIALEIRGVDGATRRSRAREFIERVGLSQRLFVYGNDRVQHRPLLVVGFNPCEVGRRDLMGRGCAVEIGRMNLLDCCLLDSECSERTGTWREHCRNDQPASGSRNQVMWAHSGAIGLMGDAPLDASTSLRPYASALIRRKYFVSAVALAIFDDQTVGLLG